MNIQLLLSVLCVIFVTRIEAFTNDDGNHISRQIEDACNYSPTPYTKCSSDCTSMTLCVGDDTPVISMRCPINKPYCLNGRCGIVNGNCRTDSSNTNLIICTGTNGTFPDPTDCTKYYVCNGTNGTDTTQLSCPPGFIYNSKLNRCDRGTPRSDHASKRICQKISCNKKPNGIILFPAGSISTPFYVNCSSDGVVQNMTLHKCNDTDYVFDLTLNTCIFKCPSAGFFPDPQNCNSYFFCEGWIKFKFTKLNCEEGQYFDGSGCVYGNCVDDTPPIDDTPPVNANGTIPFRDSDQFLGQVIKTTKSPFPYSYLWKHNGKYSIRLTKR